MRTGEVVDLHYVGHAAVTDRLLAVDPSWTWEPVALDERGLPSTDGRNLWIRLTVCGVTRLGVGDGASIKEAIGDAIRNAAMRFGVALDLWSKEELEQAQDPQPAPAVPAEVTSHLEPEATRPPASATAAARSKMFALVGELERDEQLRVVGKIVGRNVTSSNDLTAAEVGQVIDVLSRPERSAP